MRELSTEQKQAIVEFADKHVGYICGVSNVLTLHIRNVFVEVIEKWETGHSIPNVSNRLSELGEIAWG